MLQFSLPFLLGDIFQLITLIRPEPVFVFFSMVAGVSLLLSGQRFKRYFLVITAFCLGFSWTGLQIIHLSQWTLPHEWEGRPLYVNGVITSLPVVDKFGTHFIFETDSINTLDMNNSAHAKIKLSWANTVPVRVGDRYHFLVRLKRIHGLRNPGGFDYEAFAMENGLRATGAVIAKSEVKFIGHEILASPVNQIRQSLQNRINASLPLSPTAPWLLALMIGERSSAPPEHWQVLRATGTNHLMAIAGLHIGLIAGLVHQILQFFWRRSAYLSSIYPTQLASAVAALLAAWVYSGLSGFSIPTQRACIMLTFFIGAGLLRRKLPAWHAWSISLLVVLLINPLSVLSESFWLSFGTLGLIIFGMSGRVSPEGWWWKWVRVQWVIGLGLLPLSLFFFQQTSLVSVLVNSIAIPWLGILILPFCLLSDFFLLIWPPLGSLFLWIADKNLAGLWMVLEWFARISFSVWTKAMPSYPLMLITMAACLTLLMPVGVPGRIIGIIWLLPIILINPPVPRNGEFWLGVLDVGQGLSVVVQTKNHVLLFDAGPRMGGYDSGESVVLPYLHAIGVRGIDKMIISHGDNDHIGGADVVLHTLPVSEILTSAVTKFPKNLANLCLSGKNWNWDGVNFSILYPYPESLALGNDSSCVLKIENGLHSVLLTGDIEKFGENQLLDVQNPNLHAELLIVPHHGSKTSSQPRFIAAVAPSYAVFATGYRNRYRFPHASVVRNYREAGVMMLNTVETGALIFKVSQANQLLQPISWRSDHDHYWNDHG